MALLHFGLSLSRALFNRRRGRTSLALALFMAAIGVPRGGFADSRSGEFLPKEAVRAAGAPQGGVLYFVDTTSDTVVPGACANGLANCSLRGALEAANSHIGEDGIEFSLPAGSIINLDSALPSISESLSINGPGASALTVRRNSATRFRIFHITASGPVLLSGMTMTNGEAFIDGGGGVKHEGIGTLNVNAVTLNANKATIGGGGILNASSGTVNVTNSTLSGNSSGRGGGIANEGTGTLNVSSSTLNDNSTGAAGGGIAIFSGVANVTNSTLSANVAGDGGGIAVVEGTLNLGNSTLSGNAAENGGGLFSSAGTINVRSSIIALNISLGSGPDVSGTVVTGGFNLVGKSNGSTGFTALTDQVGTAAAPLDPMLASLQNNGGPTRTMALTPGSPALDKGINTDPIHLTTDQRGSGFPRTFDDPINPNANGGDGTDIGAFEVQTGQTATPTPTTTPGVTPVATPTPGATPTPTATPGTLGNISTRLRVLSGDNALIGGMIATGTTGKRVIIRAIGPSLIPFGIPGALANPTLDLFQGNTLLSSNDDWQDSPQQAEIANSGLAPSNNAESAIIWTLIPGQNYTAVVRGLNRTTGIGVVEAFDLDQAAASKLGNISTRGFVDVDDNVMIAGLIAGPSNGTSLKILARALGPTLSDFGVAGALANPTLDLVNSNGTVIRSNNNWKDDPQQRAQIEAAGLAPAHDEEAALVETVPPGAYTAVVRGSGRTTGVALVEAYNIP